MQVSQLLEDPEASSSVFSSAWRFAVVAAASGVKAVAVVVKPGTVAPKWVFERHNITVLYGCSFSSVPGVDLESGIAVVQPMAWFYIAGESDDKRKINSWRHQSRYLWRLLLSLKCDNKEKH